MSSSRNTTSPEPVPAEDLTDRLLSLCRELGCDAVGVARAEPFVEARAAIEDRIRRGYASDLGFTFRKPERSTDPTQLLPNARSLIVAARRYRRADPEPEPDGAYGRIGRYAWVDHYAPLRSALVEVGKELRREGFRTRVLADDNALVDRAAAHRAGIGWFGKNANLLLPNQGSWFVLGSLVTDADLTPTENPVADGCGTCVRCIDGCPTEAIVAPGVIDARRCLAWLVQRPGSFPKEFRVALHDRIYGCDDCQEVCPPNRTMDRRVPPAEPEPEAQPYTELCSLITGTEAQLLARHGRFYLPGRDVNILRRNALLALGNLAATDSLDHTVASDVRSAVGVGLGHEDPVVRGAAVWACKRAGWLDLLAPFFSEERDPTVLAEYAGT